MATSGLSLPCSRSPARAHGSRADKAICTLSAALIRSASRRFSTPWRQKARPREVRILVVDDEPDHLDLLPTRLEPQGFRVLKAAGADRELIAWLRGFVAQEHAAA